jgi:hypothetical protein
MRVEKTFVDLRLNLCNDKEVLKEPTRGEKLCEKAKT